MRSHEFRYIDAPLFRPISVVLSATGLCTIRFDTGTGWVLWLRVADVRGGESLFSVQLDPHAGDPMHGSSGIIHTIRYLERDEWMVWPPVELGEAWEGVVIVKGMPTELPWQPSRRLRAENW